MAVQRNGIAIRIAGVIRHIMLVLHAKWRPALLVTAKDRLLLFKRRAIPEFHMELNHPHRLIAPADGPGRLTLIGCDPDDLFH